MTYYTENNDDLTDTGLKKYIHIMMVYYVLPWL